MLRSLVGSEMCIRDRNDGAKNPTSDREGSPFSNSVSSITPAKKTAQRFDYGPTAETAKASNFDPANVKEELPMQKAQQARNSTVYNGNTRAGQGQSRTAANTGGVNQRLGSGQASRAPVVRPVGQNSTFPPRSNAATGQGSNTGGAGTGFSSGASAPAGGTSFPPARSGGAQNTPVTTPQSGSPFAPSNSSGTNGSGTLGGNSAANRFNGGGTLGNNGASTLKPSTATRFGNANSSTRR